MAFQNRGFILHQAIPAGWQDRNKQFPPTHFPAASTGNLLSRCPGDKPDNCIEILCPYGFGQLKIVASIRKTSQVLEIAPSIKPTEGKKNIVIVVEKFEQRTALVSTRQLDGALGASGRTRFTNAISAGLASSLSLREELLFRNRESACRKILVSSAGVLTSSLLSPLNSITASN